MKEHIQKPGVRKWAGQDLVDLQHEPLVALTSFFEEYGSCIIKGCEVVQTGDTYTVQPGIVAIAGTDQDGQPTFKVAPFAGISGVTLPIFLTLSYSTLERPYADLKVKPVAYDFRAIASGVKPTDKPYVEIGATGGKRFIDAIQNANRRFTTDAERAKLSGVEDGANRYVHPDNINVRHVSDAEKISWSGKTEGNHNHDTTYQPKGNYQPVGNYAAADHNHAGIYQPTGSYAASNHNHDSIYQPKGSYQPAGNYASTLHNHDGAYQPKGSYQPAGSYLQIIGTAIVDDMAQVFYKSGIITKITNYSQDGLSIEHSHGALNYGVIATCEAESAGTDFYGFSVGISAKYENVCILQSSAFREAPGVKINIIIFKT